MSDNSTNLKVLVVDDEQVVRVVLDRVLKGEGHEVSLAASCQEARDQLSTTEFDMLLVDKNLPDGDGISLIGEAREQQPGAEALVITGFANVASAVDAMRLGVADYIVKPFESLDALAERLRRAAERLLLRRQNTALMKELHSKNIRLEELVTRDSLTELHNHAYFQQRLEAELLRSNRHGHELGLLFFDIDSFKEVNDSLGHQAGDAVLLEIAMLLRGATRVSDEKFRLREHDLAARYGGDEFVVMLPETPKFGAATKAEQLRQSIEDKVIEESKITVTVSIGVASYPTDAQDRAGLVSAADTALYAAKRLGRNRVMSFVPALAPPEEARSSSPDEPTRKLLALERTLKDRAAHAVYLPIVDVSRREVIGYEALCRPDIAEFESIGDLLLASEHAGQVPELGRLLRSVALAGIGDVAEGRAMFVNLHPHELYNPALIADDPALTAHMQRLVYEVTYTEQAVALTHGRSAIAALQERGARIALDGLPISYGAFDALMVLPVDFVKIDASVLKDSDGLERRTQVIKHALEVAAAQGLTAIAKRVETQQQYERALELGFTLMQGFFFSQPTSDLRVDDVNFPAP